MDTAGGGWIVFQRRVDASVTFNRSFSEYEAGFGNLTGNLWLGLHALFMLTGPNTTLRVDMTTASNANYYAEYSQFYIDPVPLYTVHCQGYSGTAGDTLNTHKVFSYAAFDGMAFITPDNNRGNDCPNMLSAGWWYGRCFNANLNGIYRNPGDSNINSIMWLDKLLNEGSLKFVEMKLR
ncbi:hypothetical protein ACJMK2_026375 [Sinanodonta woodiana]|uniref:Fibrinogen C-terminal domain-containing protein n=1 Tax=Sinanodonta woodiana TaxID=1069815 RepID=A0ABD3XJW7_SINWO